MTCRHRDPTNNPDCSSYVAPPPTPDPSNYEVLEVVRESGHLILKVQYPSCQKCAFEGTKVLVYRGVSEVEVLRWKKIDPHFHADKVDARSAPSPIARFPASAEGWQNALLFAKAKQVRL
jgi:hypothetical protein